MTGLPPPGTYGPEAIARHPATDHRYWARNTSRISPAPNLRTDDCGPNFRTPDSHYWAPSASPMAFTGHARSHTDRAQNMDLVTVTRHHHQSFWPATHHPTHADQTHIMISRHPPPVTPHRDAFARPRNWALIIGHASHIAVAAYPSRTSMTLTNLPCRTTITGHPYPLYRTRNVSLHISHDCDRAPTSRHLHASSANYN